MLNNRNVLNPSKYLITGELQEVIGTGRSLYEGDRRMVKYETGIYLVSVRALNKDSKTLIYNYVYYPNVFREALLWFHIAKVDFRNSLVYSEWGDFLTVIDNNLGSDDMPNKLNINKHNDYLIRTIGMNKIGFTYTVNNYKELFNLINKMNVTLEDKSISYLMDLAFNKQFSEIKDFLFEGDSYSLADQTILFNHLNDNSSNAKIVTNLNALNSCLFIVNDLNTLVKNIKAKGYEMNEGPQKWRGQVNSINNFLYSLDIDFRNSLYRHNQYHVKQGKIDESLSLAKSKFSFRNIHQNIRGIRWYSTDV
jgi:hypothetical protein